MGCGGSELDGGRWCGPVDEGPGGGLFVDSEVGGWLSFNGKLGKVLSPDVDKLNEEKSELDRPGRELSVELHGE